MQDQVVGVSDGSVGSYVDRTFLVGPAQRWPHVKRLRIPTSRIVEDPGDQGGVDAVQTGIDLNVAGLHLQVVDQHGGGIMGVGQHHIVEALEHHRAGGGKGVGRRCGAPVDVAFGQAGAVGVVGRSAAGPRGVGCCRV